MQRKSVFEHAPNVRIHIILYSESLTRVFALHWNILLYPIILSADSEGPDSIVRTRRLTWVFAVGDTFSHCAAHITILGVCSFSNNIAANEEA